tara:strand:+ start:635 stop:1456 length:822 start_codon:yes stop_codon:yes gene_type:complete
MSTIIDGRGNVYKCEKEIECEDDTECELECDPKINIMSIEEYRDLKLTPEQEWNDIYNPKRVSIEALDAIEIKAKGKGPLKKLYYPGYEGGPCYDPQCNHVHIWKPKKLIKNFAGEQFANIPYIQFTEDKPGLYCCICHARNRQFCLKWNHGLDDEYEEPSILQNNNIFKKKDFLPKSKIKSFPGTVTRKCTDTLKQTNKVLSRWETIMYKVNYILNNDKVIYTISRFKSLYVWPWQLTPYQKFKLNFPDYKSSCIFVKSEILKFKDEYTVII